MKLQFHNENSDEETVEKDPIEREAEDSGKYYDDESFNEDESDEVDDNEDFVNEREETAVKKMVIMQPQSLDDGTKKIFQKNPTARKPSTQKLVDDAIKQLNERSGSSLEAIKKFILIRNPEMVENRLKIHMKRYIKNCITNGTMTQIKRSFKLTKKHEKKENEIRKQKRISKKKKKEIEVDKVMNEEKKKKPRKLKKPTAIKVIPKENSSEKLMEKNVATKRDKQENIDGKPKTAQVAKSHKTPQSAQTIAIKGMENLKLTTTKSRKLYSSVVKASPPQPKNMRSTKVKATAAASKKEIEFPTSATTSVATAATLPSSKSARKTTTTRNKK